MSSFWSVLCPCRQSPFLSLSQARPLRYHSYLSTTVSLTVPTLTPCPTFPPVDSVRTSSHDFCCSGVFLVGGPLCSREICATLTPSFRTIYDFRPRVLSPSPTSGQNSQDSPNLVEPFRSPSSLPPSHFTSVPGLGPFLLQNFSRPRVYTLFPPGLPRFFVLLLVLSSHQGLWSCQVLLVVVREEAPGGRRERTTWNELHSFDSVYSTNSRVVFFWRSYGESRKLTNNILYFDVFILTSKGTCKLDRLTNLMSGLDVHLCR